MLKTFHVPLALLCALVLSVPARSADEPKDVINKAIKAHGGAKLLTKYTAYEQTFKGTLDVQGMEIKFTMKMWAQAPTQMKSEMSFEIMNMPFTMIQAYDGKKGWRSFNGMLMDLPAAQLKEAAREMRVNWLSGQLTPLLKAKYKLTSFGEKKLEGKATTGVIVKEKGQPDFTLFFDKKSGLLAGVEYTAIDFQAGEEEVTQLMSFTDYKKEKNGLMSPQKVHIMRDGKTFLKGEVTGTTYSEKLDKSTFAKPD